MFLWKFWSNVDGMTEVGKSADHRLLVVDVFVIVVVAVITEEFPVCGILKAWGC